MKTYLGVDGGGTKTDFLLIDESGRILSRQRAGSAYYLETGVDGLRTMLANGIAATLAEGSVTADTLGFAFFGLPAHGEDSKLLSVLDAAASPTLVERPLPLRQRHGMRMGRGAGGLRRHQHGRRHRIHSLWRVRGPHRARRRMGRTLQR
jgi:hypothetical protein